MWVLWLLEAGALVSSTVLPEVWTDLAVEYLGREGASGCRGCEGVRHLLERRLPPDFNLTQLRIEIFKEELLGRLGMSEPPSRRLPPLPGPLRAGQVFKRPPSQPESTYLQRIVVMASDLRCYTDTRGLNLKFRFDIPEQAMQGGIESGKLWLYKEQAVHSSGMVSFKPCDAPTGYKQVFLHPAADYRGGWQENDITWMIQEKEECYSFKVAWPAANSSNMNCSFYQESAQKPFILADITTDEPLEGWGRKKRNANCVEGLTECCREKLFLSFAEIGWGDWIIQPKGYQAHYCKGTCANAASISLSATPYHSVLKKLYLTEGNRLHITPCCTPTRLSPVQLIYMDHNGTLVQKTIPNLTVEACGCM